MSKERTCLTVALSPISPPPKVYSLYGAIVQLIPGRCGLFIGHRYGKKQRLVLANCHIPRVGEALAAVQLSRISEVR